MTAFVSRAYNTFEQNDLLGTIRKRSTDDKLLDELDYYRSVPTELQVFFPRLISWDRVHRMIELERYDYPNLGEYLTDTVGAPLHNNDWTMIFQHLRDIIKLWSSYPFGYDAYAEAYSMYISKTIREYSKFRDQNMWPGLCTSDTLVINDVTRPNFLALWQNVQPYLQEVVIPTTVRTFMHGDCGLCNILYGPKGTLRFVDPRGSFGIKGCYGDSRYDVAKLWHSVDGHYEFLNNGLFSVGYHGQNRWSYLSQHALHTTAAAARAAFRLAFFEGPDAYDEKIITTLEGLIFIGACARHYENKDRQLALYLTGIECLDRALKL